jgi:hypothetical protein
MDGPPLDQFVRSHLAGAPRRRVFTGLVSGFLAALPLTFAGEGAEAKKKKKKKQPCPDCPICPTCPSPPPPSPPAPPFCTGRNNCLTLTTCQASGPIPCFCWVRADEGHVGEPFCGQVETDTDACANCPEGTVCVARGGICNPGFGCSAPCPNPI